MKSSSVTLPKTPWIFVWPSFASLLLVSLILVRLGDCSGMSSAQCPQCCPIPRQCRWRGPLSLRGRTCHSRPAAARCQASLVITLVACRATLAQTAVPFLQAAAHPGGSSNVNLSQALIEALQKLESSLTQKMDAQTTNLTQKMSGWLSVRPSSVSGCSPASAGASISADISSQTSSLQAQISRQQGQLNSLTQDLGERRERALMRARRGQRITDVLVVDAASALTQLLASLKPMGGIKKLQQTMLHHLFDKVG